jgi:hypothetical protein
MAFGEIFISVLSFFIYALINLGLGKLVDNCPRTTIVRGQFIKLSVVRGIRGQFWNLLDN